MKKSGRPTIKIAILAGLLGLVAVASCCAWFGLVRPSADRARRIEVAKSFLEAYSQGDCARARAFIDPLRSVKQAHYPGSSNPETFCKDHPIRIIKVEGVRDASWNELIGLPGSEVWIDGIFEMPNSHGGSYVCPHVRMLFGIKDGDWKVLYWEEAFVPSSSARYGCDDMTSMRAAISPWPHCGETPGVSAALRQIDPTTLQVSADGLKPEGVLYIFYAAKSGRDYLPGDKLSGVIPIYTLNGKSVAYVGGQSTPIDPWTTGRFVYSWGDLPRLLPGFTWEVGLVQDGSTTCARPATP